MANPHKWSPISYRSSTGRWKNGGQRLTFYHWATQAELWPTFGLLVTAFWPFKLKLLYDLLLVIRCDLGSISHRYTFINEVKGHLSLVWAVNRDEVSYQLSHDRLLDATADRRIKTRKNWVPASSDEDLFMRSICQNKVLQFWLWYMNFILRIEHTFVKCFFQDMPTNFYWNQFTFDRQRAINKLARFLIHSVYVLCHFFETQCTLRLLTDAIFSPTWNTIFVAKFQYSAS